MRPAAVRWSLLALAALIVPAAAAGPADPPAAQIRDAARRGGTLAASVDPAAGLVVRDGRGVRRVCGDEVALYVEALDRSLRTAVDDVTCTTTRRGRICRVEVRQPSGGGDPNLAIGFSRTSPAIVLAAVWSEQGVQVADVGRALDRAGPACAPATTATTTPAPAPAAPAAGPAVATRRLIRDLVEGRRRWDELVDGARGVTFVRYTSTEADPPVERWARHRCGADAVRALAAERRHLRAWMAAGSFTCTNQPGPPTCEVGDLGEFTATMRFVFRATPDGLMLDTVATINSVYEPLDQEPVLAGLRGRHLRDVCPG